MERFVALAKVEWYDEYEEEISQRTKTDYLALTSMTSFVETMREIEEYYGKDLIKAEIELFEGPYLSVSEETYDRIRKEDI